MKDDNVLIAGDTDRNVYQKALNFLAGKGSMPNLLATKDGRIYAKLGKIGIFEVFDDHLEVTTKDGEKMLYNNNGIFLKDANGANKLEIYNGDIPNLTGIIVDDNVSVPSQFLSNTSTKRQRNTYYPFNGGRFSITKPNNKVVINLSGYVSLYDTPNDPNSFYFYIKLARDSNFDDGSTITSVNNVPPLSNKSFAANQVVLENLPVGSYQLVAQAGWRLDDLYWGYNTYAGTISIEQFEQRSVIGRNGIASIWSNNEYFVVEKRGNNRLKVAMRGEDFELYKDGSVLNATLSGLPTNTTGILAGSGRLWNDKGTIKIH